MLTYGYFSLVLAAIHNTFIPGQDYMLQLGKRYGCPAIYSEIAGGLNIILPSGFDYMDNFLFRASYWIDNINDYSLQYLFSCSLFSSNTTIAEFQSLSLPSSSSELHSNFLCGKILNYVITGRVNVADAYGTSSYSIYHSPK